MALFRGEEFTPLCKALDYFSAEGLDADVAELQSSSKAMQAMFGGSTDVVAGGYDHAIRLAAEGRKSRSFLVMTTRSPLGLVASPKSPRIRRIEDLEGATVGISAYGSSGHHFVVYLLRKRGLSEKDVKFTATGGGHTVTVASIEHGELDAIVTLPASLAILRARYPSIAILANGATVEGTREIFGVDRYPGICLMARGEWIAANGEAVARLRRAMLRTLDWVRTHSAEELLAKLRNRPAEPGEIEGLREAIAICSVDGRMPPGGPEAVRDMLAASVPEVRNVDLAETFSD